MSERASSMVSRVLFIVLGVAALVAAPQEGPPIPPLPRAIPGLTAPDAFPRGCVDCHVSRPDLRLDTRLSIGMRSWIAGVDPVLLAKVRAYSPEGMQLKGRHPKVDKSLADIPNGCLKCHSQTSKSAPPFARLLHGLHLAGGAKNHYLSQFQGECTHCHKLDLKTGAWSFASGAEMQ
jgi:hypothetical protein